MAAVLENLRSTSDVSVLSLPGGGLFRDLESVLRSRSDRELLVLAIDRAAETDGSVMRLFMGRGTAGQLQRGRGTPPGLTSDTTRRAGVVSNIDLLPTALEFLGAPIPDELPGAPIRVEGEAPTELHERYLEYRRVVVPVGVAVLAFTLSALAVALVLLLTGRGGPGLSRLVAAWGVLGVSLQVALLPGSWLPTYRPWVVAVVLVAIGVAVAALAWWVGRGSPIRVPAAVAGLGLGLVVVDALLGWRSLLTPLLGGSALDGVRFYGLGNPYAGMVLAGAVLLAALLPPVGGLVLLLGAALFAGLPFLGADLGGGVTLLAVAGLWYGLRWRRSGWWALGGSVIGGVAGAILLILAHRFLPGEPTHVTRAVEGAGGVTGVAEVFLDRLRLNLEATAATPAIWPALAGIPVALWLALIRPGPFRAPLERFDEWRLGVIALAVGGMLGYVLNDTYGMASVSFIYLALALVYPALAERWTSA
ncbi:MAG TPA: hypothetical protein VJ868_05435 [Actinomycetota bacterium]|nr:hypothetical protein [Actinomycetota bacterium]